MAAAAWPQGVLIVRPPREPVVPLPRPIPPPPPFRTHALETRRIQFDAVFRDQAARTRVTQVFYNPNPMVLEGTFLFPLAEEASVSDLVVYEGEKKLRGTILDQDQARRIYDSILREMRDPGLIQYAGRNLVEARIFPIPPHGEKKIELEYTQLLRADAGLVRFSYPLGAGVRQGSPSAGEISGRISIQSAIPIRNIYSPTHAISVQRHGENQAVAGLESREARPEQDFLLYYQLSEKEFGVSLLTYRGTEDRGYFLLLLSPKSSISAGEISPKDIVFVPDISGSMNEKGKMEKVREALQYGVRTLPPGDRFNLVPFSTEESVFAPELLEASPANKDKAIRFIGEMRAAGGTNIFDALTSALRLYRPPESRPRYLVFLTDGRPTVGETAVERILERVRSENQGAVRLFTFGVGYDVNTFLLDQLAGANHGAPDYVAPEEDLEVKVSSFFDKINYPVLSEIQLTFSGISVSESYPRQLPDLFKGSQLSLLGRTSGEGRLAISLEGQYQGKKRTFRHEFSPGGKEGGEADFLPRLWASRKVGYLLDQIRLNGETAELREEVVRLARKYGFVTPYTSYLAAEDRDYGRGDRRPVFPAGRSAGSPADSLGRGVSDRAMRPAEARKELALAAPQIAAQSGEGAVWASQALQGMKDSEKISSPGKTRVVGDRTFFWKEEAWVDSEVEKGASLPRIRLDFGSEEFFQALKVTPALARFFSLGENVIVVYAGKVYEVKGTREGAGPTQP